MTPPPAAAVRRIAILPDAVANQIAAGEVVERPASVVKELVENALDAGAQSIRIELEQGGKTLVAVSDDGAGMSREDAVLALDRHATSKIATAADLVGVRTFGFRGEALPAIASVSRFTLLTSDGTEAVEITVTGGRVDAVTPAQRRRGTTVTVRGVFFNTPARRKFLRSISSEARAAAEVAATLALAHPGVGFGLVVGGQNPLLGAPGHEEPAPPARAPRRRGSRRDAGPRASRRRVRAGGGRPDPVPGAARAGRAGPARRRVGHPPGRHAHHSGLRVGAGAG